MRFEVDWRPGAIEDVRELFEYLATNASLWDAQHVTDRVLASTDKLVEFPRLYEAAPQYGEGVRRISLPRMLPAAAIQAMSTALALMRQVIETGEPIDRPDLLAGIETIMALMDYDGARALEQRLLSTEALDRKYGGGPAGAE